MLYTHVEPANDDFILILESCHREQLLNLNQILNVLSYLKHIGKTEETKHTGIILLW